MKSIHSDGFEKTETLFPSPDQIDENTNKSTMIPENYPRVEHRSPIEIIDLEKSESKPI